MGELYTYFSKGFDSHVSFCFFSISGIAPLTTCFDLQFKNIYIQKIHNFSYVFQLLCFSNITANILIVQFPINNT